MRTTTRGLAPEAPVSVRAAGARKRIHGSVSKRPPVVVDDRTLLYVVDGRTGNLVLVPIADVKRR